MDPGSQYFDAYSYCGGDPTASIDADGSQAGKIFASIINLTAKNAEFVQDLYTLDEAVVALRNGSNVLFNNSADAKAAADLVYKNGLGTVNHSGHILKGGGQGMGHVHAVQAWQGAKYVSDAGHAFYSLTFFQGLGHFFEIMDPVYWHNRLFSESYFGKTEMMMRGENGAVYYKMGDNLINGDTWAPDGYHWEGKVLLQDEI